MKLQSMGLIVFLFVLFGCKSDLISPETKNISGIYKSVAYEKFESYSIDLELLQTTEGLTGTVLTEGKKYSIKGTINNNHLILSFEEGELQLDYMDKPYYPLAGNITLSGDQRAIRFKLINKIHNQGGLK